MIGAANRMQYGFDTLAPRATFTAAHQRLIRGERTASGATGGYFRSSAGLESAEELEIGH